MTTNRTCGEAVVGWLESFGVDTVFGMPGVHTLELYRGLAGSRIHHVLARHEQGAGFMADGYARASGRPGVCLLITGPGVTNAATPIGEAYSDSVPVLIVSSVNARADLGMGRGRLHEIADQQAVTAPLTAFSRTALDAADVPELLARAFARFAGGRPRPVHLSLPLDVLAAPASGDAARALPQAPLPAPAAIDRAAAILGAAERPVIIAGGGAQHAGAEVTRLAERLGAAVVLTIAGKGIVDEAHPACLGARLHRAPVQALLAAADVVVAVGTELAETDAWCERLDIPGRLVRIDIDAETAVRDYAPAAAVVGDARAALATLLEVLPETGRGFAAAEIAAVRTQVTNQMTALERRHVRLLSALREALPADAMVASDMTQIAYTGNEWFPCAQPRSWFHPVGYGTLGYALPAAIGARLGAPRRPSAVLVGDGGLLFTVQELATAVELALPLAIVLWNNDGLGQIREGMIEKGITPIGVSPRNPDYRKLAEAFGCATARPASLDAFQRAVVGALAADRPSLIEVREDAPFLDGD